jgi:GT2 family glycosyltransferase
MTICIGVLSTNRFESLKRLLSSIRKYYEDIDIKVFDDSSVEKNKNSTLCSNYDCEFIDTGVLVGVSKNSNILLNKLCSYDYKVMINNDVEILKKGWVELYINAIEKTKIHCFTFRQLGLWGACKQNESGKRPDERYNVNGICVSKINKDPHGAFMFFDKLAHNTVGYFDTKNFSGYGRSHHLWCISMGLSGIQPEGFYDLCDSNEYIKIHNEKCVTNPSKRLEDYKRNSEKYKQVLHDIKIGNRDIYTPYE